MLMALLLLLTFCTSPDVKTNGILNPKVSPSDNKSNLTAVDSSTESKSPQKTKTPTPKTEKEKQKRFNFASSDAGASVLSYSAKSVDTQSILNRNDDKYLRMPISGPMWFVVQLSEDIMVDEIEIKNLEHYSSSIRKFQVKAASKWPVTEWTVYGEFEASDKPIQQTFEFKQPFWARFIRVEVLSYHRKEFFCTLTQINVFGSTLIESFHEELRESSIEEKEKLFKGSDENGEKNIPKLQIEIRNEITENSTYEWTRRCGKMRFLHCALSVAPSIIKRIELEQLIKQKVAEKKSITTNAKGNELKDAKKTTEKEDNSTPEEIVSKEKSNLPQNKNISEKLSENNEKPNAVEVRSGENVFKALLDRLKKIENFQTISQNKMENLFENNTETIKQMQLKIDQLEEKLEKIQQTIDDKTEVLNIQKLSRNLKEVEKAVKFVLFVQFFTFPTVIVMIFTIFCKER